MRLKVILLVIISIPLLANLCTEKYGEDSTIVFINNSADTILHYEEFRLPNDTMLPKNSWFPTQQNIEISQILPNSRIEFPGRFIALFDEMEGEVFMWYVFKYETVTTKNWDTIRSKYLIGRRYDLSLSELDSLNWTITYP